MPETCSRGVSLMRPARGDWHLQFCSRVDNDPLSHSPVTPHTCQQMNIIPTDRIPNHEDQTSYASKLGWWDSIELQWKNTCNNAPFVWRCDKSLVLMSLGSAAGVAFQGMAFWNFMQGPPTRTSLSLEHNAALFILEENALLFLYQKKGSLCTEYSLSKPPGCSTLDTNTRIVHWATLHSLYLIFTLDITVTIYVNSCDMCNSIIIQVLLISTSADNWYIYFQHRSSPPKPTARDVKTK